MPSYALPAEVLGAIVAAARPPDVRDPTIIPLVATLMAFLFGGRVRLLRRPPEVVSMAVLDGGLAGTGLAALAYLGALAGLY